MLNINTKILYEIEQYCEINGIEDPNQFCNNLIENAFTVIKYGLKPDLKLYETFKEVEDQTPQNVLTIKKNKDDYELYDKF